MGVAVGRGTGRAVGLLVHGRRPDADHADDARTRGPGVAAAATRPAPPRGGRRRRRNERGSGRDEPQDDRGRRQLPRASRAPGRELFVDGGPGQRPAVPPPRPRLHRQRHRRPALRPQGEAGAPGACAGRDRGDGRLRHRRGHRAGRRPLDRDSIRRGSWQRNRGGRAFGSLRLQGRGVGQPAGDQPWGAVEPDSSWTRPR